MPASFPTQGSGADLAAEAAAAAAQAAADAAQATATAALPKAGGTMTGKIVLDGDPTSSLHPATRQYVLAQIAAVINGAPGALDTLKEIADQLASDESVATALAGTVTGKLSAASNLSDLVNAVVARANLGLGSAATQSSSAFEAAGAVAAEATARAAAVTAEAATRAAADAALKGLVKLPLGRYIEAIPSVNNGHFIVLNRENAIGFLLGPQTFDRIAVGVSTAGGAGSVVRLGMRPENDGTPGAPAVDVTIDATTTGYKQATINYAHPGGVLYITWTGQGWSTTGPQLDGAEITGGQLLPGAAPLIGVASRVAIDWATGHTPMVGAQDGVTGALPNTWANSFGGTTLPAVVIVLRRSA